MRATQRYVIGIDEVGRGPLAGPVFVVAAAIPVGFRRKHGVLGTLCDSKQLSTEQREAWSRYLRGLSEVRFAVARVSPQVIDKINISKAANRAANKAYNSLLTMLDMGESYSAFLDGGLYIGTKANSLLLGAKTVIKGDETIPAISVASIIAKVLRDRYMANLAKQYPGYGFETHKGYGTRAHYKALRRFGPSKAHRLTFLS